LKIKFKFSERSFNALKTPYIQFNSKPYCSKHKRYEITYLFYNYVDEFGLKKTKENIGHFLSRYREEAIELIKLNNRKININKRVEEIDKLINKYVYIAEDKKN